MKKYLITLFFAGLIVFAKSAFSQVIEGITYQAVAMTENERPGVNLASYLQNQALDVRFTIIRDNPMGAILYQEVQTTTTDNYGLFSVVIGQGTLTSSSPNIGIVNLSWGLYKHLLKVEIDLKRDGNFKLMGIEQMQAVPYALHALNVPDLQTISIINDTIFLSQGGGHVVLPANSGLIITGFSIIQKSA